MDSANIKLKPTIKDVCKYVGVSTATVSRYLNKSGYVDDNTAKKIQEAIAKLNFTPSKIAKGLKTKQSQQIILVIPNISNPYYAQLYKTLQIKAQEKGYTAILFDTDEKEINELKAIELFHGLGADGLIFCTIDKSPKIFKDLQDIYKPIVVSQRYNELLFDTIHSIGGRGIQIAARYLIELGHRKIAYVGGPENSSINQRRKQGFLSALQESGIAFNQDWCFEMDSSMNAGYKAGKYLASLNDMPTAVCAANDIIAMGLILAFHECRIRIPDDISITGEDDIEFAKISRPGLTTVSNSGEFFAENAARMLFERIDGTYSGEPRELICPRELIIRDSTRRIDFRK